VAKADQGNSRKDKPETVVVVHQYPSLIEWLSRGAGAINNSKWIKWALLILLPLLVLAYIYDVGADYDIWWHMALGKYYWAHHTLRVDHAIFSWTPADSGWIYNNCLGSLILYLAYAAFSGFGLWIIQWSVLIGVFALIVLYIRKLNERLDTTSIGLIFLFFIALGVISIIYRPELFSIFFFTLFVFIYLYGRNASPKLYWLYPVLMALWVNLHGAFIFGLVLLGLLVVGEAIEYVFNSQNRMSKKHLIFLTAAAALCFLATLVNPYGSDYLLSIYQNIASASYQKHTGGIMAYLSLWPYLFLQMKDSYRFLITAYIMAGFAIFLAGLVLYGFYRKKFVNFALILINIFFFILSMKMGRAAYFFLVIGLFSIFHCLNFLDAKSLRRNLAPLALIIFLVLGGYISLNTFRYPQFNNWFGKNIEQMIPVEEARIIQKYHLPAPIFNDYLIGGYMMWAMYPEYKVFIDPRYGPYAKQVVPDYFGLTGNMTQEAIKAFAAKYPFKVAFLHMSQTPLIWALLTSEGGHWRLCYFGRNAVILIHDSIREKLPPELVKTNVSPLRFKNEDNPDVLKNLFLFYIKIGPIYGKGILEIFQRNVNERFRYKKEIEQMMTVILEQEIARIKQKMFPQQAPAPGVVQKPSNSSSSNEEQEMARIKQKMLQLQTTGAGRQPAGSSNIKNTP